MALCVLASAGCSSGKLEPSACYLGDEQPAKAVASKVLPSAEPEARPQSVRVTPAEADDGQPVYDSMPNCVQDPGGMGEQIDRQFGGSFATRRKMVRQQSKESREAATRPITR